MLKDKLIKRSEVPQHLTWRVEDIFEDEESWQKALREIEDLTEELATFKGRVVESAKTLYAVISLYEKVEMVASLTSGYAARIKDTDTSSAYGQSLYSKAIAMRVKMGEKLSFIDVEINEAKEDKIQAYIKEEPALEVYQNVISDIRRMKDHTLSKDLEKILASAGQMANVPYESFGALVNADMKFPEVEDANGERIAITNGRFIPLLEGENRELRKEVFTKFYETFKSYQNTLATLYSGQVSRLMFYSQNRNYASNLEAALDHTNVSIEVYHNLIEAVRENMEKMYRYIRLRKKVLGVDELHMYDVYVPIVKDVELHYTIEEAKALVLEALKPLGEEYIHVVKQAFLERWIDVVENEGKRAGAYSAGIYGVHPFILLNFNGTLANVFTLAHEMGHAMHSYYSNQKQSFLNSTYEIFVAEVASTTNEVLLLHYLLEHAASDKEKAGILNHYLNSFKGTIFRQTMFAEFEMKANALAESGVPLQAENLSELYYQLNRDYFGPDMVLDELIRYEWLRIPHFYYNFYVFQYATGYSAAVSIARRILKEGEAALRPYMEFLSSGCTSDPVSLLKIAGVDMTSKEPIHEALKVFEEVLEQMEELYEKGIL